MGSLYVYTLHMGGVFWVLLWWIPDHLKYLETLLVLPSMESLAQLEALCERLYNSQDSAERAHAESTLKCFSLSTEYISQCQYILDNALTPYALMLASSSLLKQVTEHSLSLQLRLDIRNTLILLMSIMLNNVFVGRSVYYKVDCICFLIFICNFFFPFL